ncbi:autotransporter domain-containing protein [bacterium]|nr:autotransporter domain-containing protein [bacterium]
MRRIVIILALLAVTAPALELGVTLSARGLFALSDIYSFEGVWEQSVETGVQFGFGFMLNLYLGGGFALGPYASGVFFTDEISLDDPYSDYDITYTYDWTELLFGLGARYDFITDGSYRPWLRIAGGYLLLDLSVTEERAGEEAVETESSGGNYGLEAGLGLDLYMSDYFSVGLSCEFRLNGVGVGSEGDGVLADTAMALGAGVNLGFVF